MEKILLFGEKICNMEGSTIDVIKSLTKHDFFIYSVAIDNNRREIYTIVARIMFYKFHGLRDSTSEDVLNFLVSHNNINIDTQEYKDIVKCLDYLTICFPKKYCYLYNAETAKKHYLFEKSSWVLSLFMFVDNLMKEYLLVGHEEEIKKFFYYLHTVTADNIGAANIRYFADSLKSGWSEKHLLFRKNFLIIEFLKKHKLEAIADIASSNYKLPIYDNLEYEEVE